MGGARAKSGARANSQGRKTSPTGATTKCTRDEDINIEEFMKRICPSMIKLFLKIRLILQFKTLSSLSANWLTLQLQTNLKTNPSPAGHRNQDLKMHQWKSR